MPSLSLSVHGSFLFEFFVVFAGQFIGVGYLVEFPAVARADPVEVPWGHPRHAVDALFEVVGHFFFLRSWVSWQ
jgi:hypothetical protein